MQTEKATMATVFEKPRDVVGGLEVVAIGAGFFAFGRELGALVVGEVEARRRVGLGEELEGGGLAGAGEGEDAQRALGVGAAGRDDGVLLGAGLQRGLLGGTAPPA